MTIKKYFMIVMFVSTMLTHGEGVLKYLHCRYLFLRYQYANIEIQKWGNSAAIRLNKGILQQVSCEIGSKVEAVVKDGGVFLKPITAPTYTMEELLSSCTKENVKLEEDLNG